MWPFESKDIQPCYPPAQEFASALIAMIDADNNLKQAIKNVPSYTGNLSDADYYAEEQEAWNRAAEELYKTVPSKTIYIDPDYNP